MKDLVIICAWQYHRRQPDSCDSDGITCRHATSKHAGDIQYESTRILQLVPKLQGIKEKKTALKTLLGDNQKNSGCREFYQRKKKKRKKKKKSQSSTKISSNSGVDVPNSTFKDISMHHKIRPLFSFSIKFYVV